MELNILTLLLALGNLAAGLAIGVYLRKRLVEGNQRNIALQGRQIIENAIAKPSRSRRRPCSTPRRRPCRSSRRVTVS